jgi:hypothetical protein
MLEPLSIIVGQIAESCNRIRGRYWARSSTGEERTEGATWSSATPFAMNGYGAGVTATIAEPSEVP